MRWAGHVACTCEVRGCIGSWWGKWRERDHCGELSIDAWKIRMDLQEVGFGCVDSIGLAQDRDRWWKLVGAVMNLWVL